MNKGGETKGAKNKIEVVVFANRNFPISFFKASHHLETSAGCIGKEWNTVLCRAHKMATRKRESELCGMHLGDGLTLAICCLDDSHTDDVD
jgi:hypothetical protein